MRREPSVRINPSRVILVMIRESVSGIVPNKDANWFLGKSRLRSRLLPSIVLKWIR